MAELTSYQGKNGTSDDARKARVDEDHKKGQGQSYVGVCCSTPLPPDSDPPQEVEKANKLGLEYGVDETPAIHLCLVFGLQQVLLAISSTISIPIIVSDKICAGDLELVKSEIMSTFLFMCGVCTVLQVLLGVRLPIIQGGCHKFIPAITALMALEKWQCPDVSTGSALNGTALANASLDRTEVWQSRMREIQGGIIVASITQVVIGCTGFLGVILQYIGPITIVPTITLVGLSLIDVAIRFCEKQWGITALTIFLAFVFALYMRNIRVPVPAFSRSKRCHVLRFPIFKLFPVILAIAISWSVCAILTETDVFTSDKSLPEYYARTDARSDVISNAGWFFFPYPGQWGMPTISVASYMAMLAATVTSIIESVGDYYACARISAVPPPPAHAINRGIAIEGFGSIISGFVGSGGATTSYSQNVGAIGFTKVASRSAFVAAGLIFLFSGIIEKFGAALVMLPDPVLGGIVVISFGMVTSVGLSNLQFVDLSSGRNLCIIGSSLLVGLMIPRYLSTHKDVINTGNVELDQVLFVLLSTAMFVGGVIGFILDNTVPGTDQERGILKWRKQLTSDKTDKSKQEAIIIYDLPIITPTLRRIKCCSYVPFLPSFAFDQTKASGCCGKKDKGSLHTHSDNTTNGDIKISFNGIEKLG